MSNNINRELTDLLLKYGNNLVSKMVAIIISKNKRYTDRLMNSFSINVMNTLDEVGVKIVNSAPYASIVDQGGPLYIKPTFQAIFKWAQFKGLEKYSRLIYKRIIAPSYVVKGIYFTSPLTEELHRLSISPNIQNYIVEYLKKEIRTVNGKSS